MGTPNKLKRKAVKDALLKSGGMPTVAAKLLGVAYPSLFLFIKKHPDLKDIQESARAKLHEELESLTTFAVKTGYIQKSKLDEDGKPTSETEFEEVDVRTRLSSASQLMGMYRASVGIKEEIDITSNNKALKGGGITVIELPEHLRPRPESEEIEPSEE